ncbi:hypothetical protein D088_500009 [Salmonella enterica subsp. houtenae serovar 16:z4,z32:-- str. RKS3027]|nr:hypothetical protein D088_500009 [Salmonella enterica subsp. houtenae serovar 16:z4,z32:-- str. RKS3027]
MTAHTYLYSGSEGFFFRACETFSFRSLSLNRNFSLLPHPILAGWQQR